MADEFKVDRTPYKVTYQDLQGKMQTITRTAPPKLHDALPEDIVTLDRKRSDDFDAGNDFEVKHINPRHANTLQLVREGGATTFVDYYDVTLKEEVTPRDENAPRINPNSASASINNRYLLWP